VRWARKKHLGGKSEKKRPRGRHRCRWQETSWKEDGEKNSDRNFLNFVESKTSFRMHWTTPLGLVLSQIDTVQ